MKYRYMILSSVFVLACGSSSEKKRTAEMESRTTAPHLSSPGLIKPQTSDPSMPSQPNGELWVDPNSQAAQDALSLNDSQPDARRLQYIAAQPMAHWLGEWSGEVEEHVRSIRSHATGKILTLVVYNVPYRDCGSYSAGGSKPQEYRDWIAALTRGLGSHEALIIMEPDALAQMDCLPAEAQAERLALLKDAVAILKKAPGARVYLDAGHPAWKPVDVMAERLLQADVMAADGFALNVSNFQTLEANIEYGGTLRSRLAGKHFLIDTSRNGRGPDPQGVWCNPRGRALGRTPTLETGIEGVDAFLWVKRPGESDGPCNGGPGAGQWWREIALEMAREAGI